MLDDFSKTVAAYSFGINDDISWDIDVAKRGVHCYMYDYTITSIPDAPSHLSSLLHWFRI